MFSKIKILMQYKQSEEQWDMEQYENKFFAGLKKVALPESLLNEQNYWCK
jgi:hypothetical protein